MIYESKMIETLERQAVALEKLANIAQLYLVGALGLATIGINSAVGQHVDPVELLSSVIKIQEEIRAL